MNDAPSVQRLAGIEAGGTKFECGLCDLQLNVVARVTITTRAPQETFNDHPAWSLEIEYVAQGLVNLIYTTCPERVIVGGGVGLRLHRPALISRIRALLGDYLMLPQPTDHLSDYIVPPALGDVAGLIGALILAKRTTLQS